MSRILLLTIIMGILFLSPGMGNNFAARIPENFSEQNKFFFPETKKKQIEVTARIAYVREYPDFDAPVKYRLIKGEAAELLKAENGWYHIKWNKSHTGWVYKNYVRLKEFRRSIKKKGLSDNAALSSGKEKERRVSLNFVNTDIRKILSAIALEQELDIAIARGVKGKVSIHLFNVPLEDALDALTMTGGNRFKKVHGLYYIYKPENPTGLIGEKLVIRVFRLRFIDVTKIKEILEAIPGMRTIEVHEPSKTIIVEDSPQNIAKIETIINQWDLVPKQVLIEARIMEVSLNDAMAFGVNWAKLFGDVSLGTGGFSSGVLPDGSPVPAVPSEGTGFFANLLTGAGSDHQFSLALDALKTQTKVETLSTPKILAIHGKAAKVQVGGQQGYKVTTTNLGVATESIEFINTGTILEITPHIQENNTIMLNVKPSINSAIIEQGIPVVNATRVSTWLLAGNGETVFIGGLIQDRQSDTRHKIPFLGDIPFLGRLFRRTVRGKGKTELVVFITPRILKPSGSVK